MRILRGTPNRAAGMFSAKSRCSRAVCLGARRPVPLCFRQACRQTGAVGVFDWSRLAASKAFSCAQPAAAIPPQSRCFIKVWTPPGRPPCDIASAGHRRWLSATTHPSEDNADALSLYREFEKTLRDPEDIWVRGKEARAKFGLKKKDM